MKRLRITVCCGPDCGRDSEEIQDALCERIESLGVQDQVELEEWSCFGRCRSGPNLVVRELKELAQAADDTNGIGLAGVASAGRSTMYNQMTPGRAVLLLDRRLAGLND